MPLIRRRIIYMHDGCPAHYAGKIKYFNVTQRGSNGWQGHGGVYLVGRYTPIKYREIQQHQVNQQVQSSSVLVREPWTM